MSDYQNENQRKFIDVDVALSRVRGNKTLYCKLLKMYLASGEFDAFEQHIAANDNQKACEAIHSIKGLSGNLSLDSLYNISAKLNQQLVEGRLNQADLLEYREISAQTREAVTQFIADQLEK